MTLSSVFIVTALILVHAVLLVVPLRRNFAVVDEVAHVPAGVSHWELGDFSLYRVNPPLARMLAALPVLLAHPRTAYDRLSHWPGTRAEWGVAYDFAALNAERYVELIDLARGPGVLWSLLGAWVIYLWGRDLYGRRGGCLGAALWVFDPTVLAFAPVVIPDVPAAVAGLVATYTFWRYLRHGSWRLAVGSGVLLGVAQLMKFTLVVLYVAWPLIALAHHLGTTSAAGPRPRLGRGVLQGAFIFLTSLYIINNGYFFRGTGRALGDLTFVSRTMTAQPPGSAPGAWVNRFHGTWLGRVPLPVPADYVQGIDVQKREFENAPPSYMAGRWRGRGWWYYYIYALSVKEPSGTLALVAVGLVLTACLHPSSASWPDELAVLLPAALVLALVSSETGLNQHMRYILPAFPFLAVATGKLAWVFRARRPKAGILVLALLGWSAVSSLRVWPYSMSYFNEAAGGPENGYKCLAQSNIDWGQDLLELRGWLRRHPGARPLGLVFFHMIDPLIVGVDYRLPPLGPPGPRGAAAEGALDPARAAEFGPHPGFYAVSVNYLAGITGSAPDGQGGWVNIDRPDAFAYFRHFRPIARAGYSINIYHITPAEADSVRRRLGLPTLPGGGEPHSP